MIMKAERLIDSWEFFYWLVQSAQPGSPYARERDSGADVYGVDGFTTAALQIISAETVRDRYTWAVFEKIGDARRCVLSGSASTYGRANAERERAHNACLWRKSDRHIVSTVSEEVEA